MITIINPFCYYVLMVVDNYGLDLDEIIRKSHKESKEYLKRSGSGIEIKGVRLRILESSDLLRELYDMIKTYEYDIDKLKQELNIIDKSLSEQISNDDVYIINKENLREFYIGELSLLSRIYNTDDIKELNNKMLKYVVLPIKENERADGSSVLQTEEIYIIKDRLKERIDETLNRLGPININGPSIIRLKLPSSDVIYFPLYTEGKNIEKDVAKAYAANITIHELVHHIVDRKRWDDREFSVSALQYIMYIDMHDLLKYPETHKIIEENIQECKKYIETFALFGYRMVIGDLPESSLKYIVNVLKRAPYELGEGYANVIIDRNKNLNIKDVVEEVKKFICIRRYD